MCFVSNIALFNYYKTRNKIMLITNCDATLTSKRTITLARLFGSAWRVTTMAAPNKN
jgi:hypothetical protein